MNPQLGEMLDPAAARKLLEGGGIPVADLTVLNANLREDWAIQYQARILDSARLLTAQRFLNGALPKAVARISQQLEKAAAKDPVLPGLVREFPDRQCVVFPFPLDAQIKYLPKTADPRRVRRRFHAERCEVDVLRYVPGRRCQFLYRFPSGEVLGKVFRDERGEAVFRWMQQVAARFRDYGDPLLTTPRALEYLPDWQMLVQEKAPGRTLYDIIRDGDARDRHIEAAARSIAVLHGASLDPGSYYALSDEVQLLDWSVRSLEALDVCDPEFCRVLDRIRAFRRPLRAAAPVPVHRDFYDKQLLMSGDSTALIDFDTLALGHAEIDVANFIAHLHLRPLEGIAGFLDPRRWESVFLNAYRRSAPAPPDERLLRFFLSTTYFRLASKNRIRTNGAGAPWDRLLGLAGRALEGV